tara:strand:+ start:19420 stop:20655 length:1236 start_codon:yes stop_codon:yes gene_type:complete
MQAICYNHNFIDSTLHDKITTFTDNVPYDSSDIDYDELDRITQTTDFKIDSLNPMKSGMISLVYPLTEIKTGKKCILKLKRKNIKQKLERGIKNMEMVIEILTFVTKYFMSVEIMNTVKRHLNMLFVQLDFEKEKENTRRIAKNFDKIDYVRVPEIVDYDSDGGDTKSIIMTRLPGVPLSEVKKEDYPGFCKALIKHGFCSMLVHGITHGDFHPGNVLFIKNEPSQESLHAKYQVGVIDFGLVIEISEKMRQAILFAGTKYRNPNRSKKIIYKYLDAAIDPPNILETLKQDTYTKDILSHLATMVKEVGQDTINCSCASHLFKGFEKVNDMMMTEEFRNRNVTMTDDFVKLQVAMSMSNGVAMELLGPNENYSTYMDTTLGELFHFDLIQDSDDSGSESEAEAGLESNKEE